MNASDFDETFGSTKRKISGIVRTNLAWIKVKYAEGVPLKDIAAYLSKTCGRIVTAKALSTAIERLEGVPISQLNKAAEKSNSVKKIEQTPIINIGKSMSTSTIGKLAENTELIKSLSTEKNSG
jgi:hypothetical protein